MKLYKDKLILHRRQSHLSSGKIAEAMGISRTTYWKWEKGISNPNSKQIRTLASILEISVSDISDLPPLSTAVAKNSTKLSENINSWLSFFDSNESKNFHKTIADNLNASIKLSNKLKEAGIIIEALLSGINSVFYIKNINLQYMTANDAFLKNISLKPSFTVFGKTDEDFFNKIEAKENSDKDEKVLITKKQSIEEGFIPGSKKKKWGIISRTPVFDLHGNIAGLVTNIVDITARKKAESTVDMFKEILSAIDETIWIAKSAKMKGNMAYFSNYIYFAASKLMQKAKENLGDIPFEEVNEKAWHWIIKDDKRKKINLKLLKKKRTDEVKYKLKFPNDSKIYNMHSKIYYHPDQDIYSGILREDTENTRIEKIINKLKKYGIDEKIINDVISEE